MKKHYINKRLTLGKMTIASLESEEMFNARGGCTTETIGITCDNACTTDPNLNQTVTKPSANTCYTIPGDND